MKKRAYAILMAVVFAAGFALIMYPSVSNYINIKNTKAAVESYNERLSDITAEEKAAFFNKAHKYNDILSQNIFAFEYNSVLNISDGMMGYISIPKIGVVLPIQHGTDEKTLSFASGHIEGTSFPVGGQSTHAAITGHRGLPSAKLFTDLDELETGDKFSIRILDEILTYEVDKISVVKPEEVEQLKIVDGKDYVTLITCTPYGINTHRLLVRGVRTQSDEDVLSDAVRLNTFDTVIIIALPLAAAVFAAAVLVKRRKKK